MHAPSDPPESLAASLRSSWPSFLDTYEPLRSELYRYCRHLTRSPWDAEDLAQDAMARAFVTLGQMGYAPPNPRAWLFGQLSPQERAAVVLKDAFDLSLEEIAEALSTTTGAVKAALHRGRGKLVEPATNDTPAPAPGVLNAFCAAFNAGDMQGVLPTAPRVELDGDRVALLRNYFFNPDFIAEVCGELGLPWRSNGYRWSCR